MLTQRDLAAIRAALMFFDEEMSPNDWEVARFYFEEPIDAPFTADDIRRLRELLMQSELRYLGCNREGTEVLSRAPFTSIEAAQEWANSSRGRIATVLWIVAQPESLLTGPSSAPKG